VDTPDAYSSDWDTDLRELRVRLAAAGVFLVAVILAGTVGYRIVEPSAGWIDALYMTVITLTTVGFTEVVDLTGHPGGRLFTVVLIMVGMGGVLYFVTTATAFVLEGQLGHVFWRRRMEKLARSMTDHLIVCGSGGTAVYTADELESVRRPVVLVCDDPGRLDSLRSELPETPILEGDPTREDVLIRAGVEHAAGIAACTRSDKDNLIIALTARQMNPEVRIVSRVTDVRGEGRIRKVGADSVVSPHFIGALRIASELVRPAVVSFLDVMLRDRERGLRIEEVRIPSGSPFAGRSVEDLRVDEVSDALLLAVRDPGGEWRYNPPPEHPVEADTVLILMATPEDLDAVVEAHEGDVVARPTRSRPEG